MQRTTLILGLLLAGCIGFVVACGGSGKPADNTKSKASADKVTRPEVADAYQGMAMPDGTSAEAGKELFAKECASCHGVNGDGDSPTGKALKPQATDLTAAAFQDAVGDDYLFWRISEGGQFPPFNSGMLPVKDKHSEAERWELVAYVRSLKK